MIRRRINLKAMAMMAGALLSVSGPLSLAQLNADSISPAQAVQSFEDTFGLHAGLRRKEHTAAQVASAPRDFLEAG